ncbi:MAG: peptidylamidoglycolate lyase [Congregibacter sp.]|jgi:peptidylamidoglycolate lyase
MISINKVLIRFALLYLLLNVNFIYAQNDELYSLNASWPQLPAEIALGQATGVAVDSHNHVFIFHRAKREWVEPFPEETIQEHTIFMFEGSTGNLLDTWGGGQFIMPHGLSVDPEDNVWVTDVGSQQIHKFSHDGVLLLSIGENGVQGTDQNHFARPSDLGFTKNGGVYVSDGYINTRVITYTPSGTFDFQWGTPGSQPGNFDLPHGIAVNNDKVYVADRGNARLQIFDHNGVYITEWKNEQIGRPYGVAVNQNEEVFIIDGGDQPSNTRSRVIVLNSNGDVIESFNAAINSDDSNLGHDIAIGNDGAVYVVDAWARSVRKFTKSNK